jgi:exodeoxyribonuclease VII large subunit
VDSFRPETRMALGFDLADEATARAPLTVSALNRAVAGLLERSFPLVRVQGEVCNLTRAASGHWYFGLKDDIAQVRCVMFRARNSLLDWIPRDGDDIEATARVTLYEARGEYQLNVEYVRRAGLGRLYEEFLRLKQRLAAEGLFDSGRKRPLPRLPRAVGVVTSLQAAALHDVLTALQRRAPFVSVVVYPVPVQGAGAGARIAEMLGRVAQRNEVDVVLLVRGGGSLEDLWSFNEEVVARAIRACPRPVVVGVGHESDTTIADFAADVRAPTPTAAAELVAPSADTLRDEVASEVRHLARQLQATLQRAAQRVDYAQRSVSMRRAPFAAIDARIQAASDRTARAMAHRFAVAQARYERLGERLRAAPEPARAAALRAESLRGRLIAAVAARLAGLRRHAETSADALALLDPARVLARGYSIVRSADGRTVRAASALATGERVSLEFGRGSADALIERLRDD